jgi:CRISPR-associated protein (TIGR03984 family)
MSETFHMTDDRLREAAKELDDGSAWYVYLEGLPFTTFAVLHVDTGLELPPSLRDQARPWHRFQEVRIFNEDSEWHAWSNGGNVWRARLARGSELDKDHRRERRFVLAGNKPEPARDGWCVSSEASGTEVWLPVRAAERGHPLCLNIRERIDMDPVTGLAGVVDAMFRGFVALSEVKDR